MMRLGILAAVTIGCFSASTAFSGEYDRIAREMRQKYSYLYNEPVRDLPDGSQSFHQGRLFKRGGINVLHMKGDDFEMAFQHGKLLREEARQGAIRVSASMIRNNLRMSIGDRPLIVQIATNYVHRNYTQKMIDYTAAQTQSEASIAQAVATADSTGLEVEEVVKAMFGPETLFFLAGKTIESGGEDVIIIPTVGNCSAFVGWDSYTANGRLIIGRNTDFPLNGYYDRFPTAMYFEPTNGQKYMTIASAGVHSPGVIAMNESGLYMFSHTIPTTEVSEEGMPVFVMVGNLIKQAKTFDEAVRYMKRFKPAAGWAYTIVSTKERRIGTIEINNKNIAVRESFGGWHVQTNQFMTPEMIDQQQFINKSVDYDAIARYVRMQDLLNQNLGKLNEDSATKILGDHFDPLLGEVTGLPNTVSVHTTMTSLVALPEDGKIFVGSGRAPVSESTFIELPTVEHFDREAFATQTYKSIANDDFAREHPAKAEALQLFIQAKQAYEYSGDIEAALALLKQASAKDPENFAYHFEAGIFALQNNDLAFAQSEFESILNLKSPSHSRNLARYYLGRTLSARGNQERALSELRSVRDSSDAGPKLATAAKNAFAWITENRQVYELPHSALRIMMQQADMMSYE